MARFLVLLFIFISQVGRADGLPTMKARLGKHEITIEIAESDEDRGRGLMYRKQMPEKTGMLFVFEKEQPLTFWMKNTLIPLSIGFFDRKLRLIDIQEMTPATVMEKEPPRYTSQKPAILALEMNRLWFKHNNVKVGAVLQLLSTPPTPRLRALRPEPRPKSK